MGLAESERYFLNNEVAKIVDLTDRQVLNLADKGFVVPSVPAIKAGGRRKYSYLNLLEFAIARHLLNHLAVSSYNGWVIMKSLRSGGPREDDNLLELWHNRFISGEINAGLLIYYIAPHDDWRDSKRPPDSRVTVFEEPFVLVSDKDLMGLIKNPNDDEKEFIETIKGSIIVNLVEIKKWVDEGLSLLG